jgi:hypothetical protein
MKFRNFTAALAAFFSLASPALAAPPPSFTIGDVTVNEDSGFAALTVTKSAKSNSISRVTVKTSDGTAKALSDYRSTNTTISFANSEMSKIVNVPIINDTVVESTEAFNVNLISVRNARIARSPGVVTITDNDVGAPPPPPPPPPTPPPVVPTWTQCATQGGTCYVVGTANVRYGANGVFFTKSVTGSIVCDVFPFGGDPIFGVLKTCQTDGTVAAPPPPDPSCSPIMTYQGVVTCTNIHSADPPVEETAIADNFDYSSAIETIPGNGGAVAQASPDDTVGAERMFCTGGKVINDDPIVKHNLPGASHTHTIIGNQGTDAFSTYTSLRTTGSSNCGGTDTPPNRSAYWMPSLIDGVNVLLPDKVYLYYKMIPAGSPGCTDPVKKRGICTKLPNGLRYVFGYNTTTNLGGLTDPNTPDYWLQGYFCASDDPVQQASITATGHYRTIDEMKAAGGCPVGAHFNIVAFAEDCWDGVHLDTADHRSHMAYASGNDLGYGRQCDAAHPHLIPDLQFNWQFTVDANFSNWHLSSDEMVPGAAAGSTLHMDYWEAWSPTAKAMWQIKCIDGWLSCANGDLGNGTEIKNSGLPDILPLHVLVPRP